ncbi:MAG TPA: tyrosine-type recombinase/integrase [Clostridia bacterium]|nr:tyrosine-type recombinase/integrase [Clostridia bacterium]
MGRLLKLAPKVTTCWDDVADYFLLFKRSQGVSQRTLEDYSYHLSLFLRRASLADIQDYESLRASVLRYFADGSSLAPATFNTRLKILRSFFSWCVSEGYIPANPVEGIKNRKCGETPRAAGEDTLRRLLSLPDVRTFAGLRDRALLILTLDTGIRPKEACGLRIGDFDLRGLEVTIPASVAKTRVSRTLPISPVTADAVGKLISARHPSWDDAVPVFCTEDGKTMTHNAWDRRLQIYSQRLGVKVRPYDLRHSFALMFLRNGGNAFSLQKTLGHSSMAMTRRYVALTQNDLREQHSKASPLNTLLPRRSRVRKVKETTLDDCRKGV